MEKTHPIVENGSKNKTKSAGNNPVVSVDYREWAGVLWSIEVMAVMRAGGFLGEEDHGGDVVIPKETV